MEYWPTTIDLLTVTRTIVNINAVTSSRNIIQYMPNVKLVCEKKRSLLFSCYRKIPTLRSIVQWETHPSFSGKLGKLRFPLEQWALWLKFMTSSCYIASQRIIQEQLEAFFFFFFSNIKMAFFTMNKMVMG